MVCFVCSALDLGNPFSECLFHDDISKELLDILFTRAPLLRLSSPRVSSSGVFLGSAPSV